MRPHFDIVVPVSGGKDSQACLKLAVEHVPRDNVLGLFCDTQFEHPTTYAHVDRMRTLYGVRIVRICAGSVLGEVRKYRRFPGGGARHCTSALKIRPSKTAYRRIAEKNGPFEVWYGVRATESPARAKKYAHVIAEDTYAPHEFMPTQYPKYLAKMGVSIRVPIVEWSTEEVLSFLEGEENPLYAAGFDRVGCFPCLAAGDATKLRAFSFDAFGKAQAQKIAEVESEIGRSVFTSKAHKGSSCDPGCAICQM